MRTDKDARIRGKGKPAGSAPRIGAAQIPPTEQPAAGLAELPDELRSIFEAAGFEPAVWNEQETALAEIAQRTFTPTVDPMRVGLARLMPDFDQRMGNVGRNIAEGRLGLLQAVLHVV